MPDIVTLPPTRSKVVPKLNVTKLTALKVMAVKMVRIAGRFNVARAANVELNVPVTV